jgi:hypothetical protein
MHIFSLWLLLQFAVELVALPILVSALNLGPPPAILQNLQAGYAG